MEAPVLALIPSGVKAGKVYSILPNNGTGDFTFTRASEGTRIDESGLINVQGSGIPRLDWGDGDCPSLLLEPQRTNIIDYSEILTFWNSVGATFTGNQSAPDGTVNALKIDLAAGQSYLYNFPGVNGLTYTISGYFRADSPTTIGFSNGANIANPINVTTQWKRFETTFVRAAGGIQIDNYFGVQPGQLAKSFYAWGLQMEEGLYASSYIGTKSAAVTRLVDTCEVASGLQEYIGQNKGTLFVDFEYLAPIENNSSTDSIRDIFILGKSGDTSNYITFDNYRSIFRVLINQSGVVSAVYSAVANSALANTRYRFAIRYESGNSKSFLNGSLLGSNSVNINFGAVLDGIFFSWAASSRTFRNQKKVYDLRTYKEALTDAQLIELTTL
mgnify:FL=1